MNQDTSITLDYIKSVLPPDHTIRPSPNKTLWKLYDKYNFTIADLHIRGSKIIVIPKRRPVPNNGYNPIQLNLADVRFLDKLLNIISKKPKPMED